MPYKNKDDKKKHGKEYYQKYRKRILEQQKKYAQEHREEKRKYLKQWGIEHKEHRKKYRQDHKEQIKEAKKEWDKKTRLLTPWVYRYHSAKARCTNPSVEKYPRYGGRGIQFLLTQKETEILWKRDNADEMKCPSIDRIDNDGDYCFDNCHFIEHAENSRKARKAYGDAFSEVIG